MTTTAIKSSPDREAAARGRAPQPRARARGRAGVLRPARPRRADGRHRARREVGVGTVYRHFPTKEALAEAIAADHFDRLAASAREALENPDPWEGFSTFLRSSAQVQAGDRALAEVMAAEPEVMCDAAQQAPRPPRGARRARARARRTPASFAATSCPQTSRC